MKLLDKKTVHTVMAGQRKSQIDEGVTIAKKIDALRETLSSLQHQHQLYIQGMTGELQQATQTLQADIDSKKKEITELEEQRRKLLEPLTNAWVEIQARQAEVDSKVEDLYAKEVLLNQLEENINIRSVKVVTEELVVANSKAVAHSLVEEANKTLLEAKNGLLQAKEYESDIKAQLEIKINVLGNKESELAVKERDLQTKQSLLERQEVEITKQITQLADQRNTLERAMKRLNI